MIIHVNVIILTNMLARNGNHTAAVPIAHPDLQVRRVRWVQEGQLAHKGFPGLVDL